MIEPPAAGNRTLDRYGMQPAPVRRRVTEGIAKRRLSWRAFFGLRPCSAWCHLERSLHGAARIMPPRHYLEQCGPVAQWQSTALLRRSQTLPSNYARKSTKRNRSEQPFVFATLTPILPCRYLAATCSRVQGIENELTPELTPLHSAKCRAGSPEDPGPPRGFCGCTLSLSILRIPEPTALYPLALTHHNVPLLKGL